MTSPKTILKKCWIFVKGGMVIIKHTDWIVKRACRTMLKAGNKRALTLFGFGDPGQTIVEALSFDRQSLSIGEELLFSFEIKLQRSWNPPGKIGVWS